MTGKKKAMIFRTSEEKHAQILRLADALGLGTGKTVSMTEVIEMAIDALAYRPVPAGAGPAVLRPVALRRTWLRQRHNGELVPTRGGRP